MGGVFLIMQRSRSRSPRAPRVQLVSGAPVHVDLRGCSAAAARARLQGVVGCPAARLRLVELATHHQLVDAEDVRSDVQVM